MKKNHTTSNSLTIASIAAVAVFAALTVFANGIVEISSDAGFVNWVGDLLVYSIGYKLGYKLIASAFAGLAVYFVSSMIEYGRSVKARKQARTTSVRFVPEDKGAGKIA